MKKKLLSLVCVLLLVVGSVFGTYAYLTAQDTVTNTFTVGKVGLDLNESVTDEYGVATGGKTETGNEYKLMPGHTYVKDPTVTVTADSEKSYVRMLVKVVNMDKLTSVITKDEYYDGNLFLLEKLCTGWNKDVWECVGFDTTTSTYEFRYHETVSTVDGAAKTLEPLFTNIVVPDFVTNTQLETLGLVDIQVTAHAIQADGFGTAAEAWAKF